MTPKPLNMRIGIVRNGRPLSELIISRDELAIAIDPFGNIITRAGYNPDNVVVFYKTSDVHKFAVVDTSQAAAIKVREAGEMMSLMGRQLAKITVFMEGMIVLRNGITVLFQFVTDPPSSQPFKSPERKRPEIKLFGKPIDLPAFARRFVSAVD